MGFERGRRVAARVGGLLLLPLLGAGAMLAWVNALYANMLLALLLIAWTAALVLVSVRRQERAPSAPVRPLPGEEVAREHRRLTAYLNLSPAPLVTLEDGVRLRAVNRAARRLFGADDIVPDPPSILTDAIAATEPGRSVTVRFGEPDAVRAYALATADLRTGPAGSRIAALVDIGAELRAAEAGALRDLLQVLSHEIMNALTPIASLGRTAADLLAEGGDAEAARDAVETMARRAEGLQRFSRSYRDLARLPPPEIRRIEVKGFVVDLQRLFATRWPAIALVVEADQAPGVIPGDADQLSAAIWALLQNAAEASEDGALPRVTLAARAVSEGTLWQVGDSGPGVAEGDREAIFQPFFTTKPAGSGVGLALVRQIAHAHRGTLTLDEPAVGEGARFALFVPGR